MNETSLTVTRTRSTLHDVARAAGVSVSTVSSVLAGNSGHRRISEDTRRKVRGAATELGYTPNLLHRSMRRGRTHVISLYNAFRSRNPGDLYMDRLSEGIERAGGDLGYDILVHSNFKRDVKETYEFLNGGLADGLVLFGPTVDEPLLPLLRSSNLPTVLIGPRYNEETLSSVVDDEEMGIGLVADALLERGHRRIGAIVESVSGRLDPTGRLSRLKRALADGGVTFDDRDAIVWNGSPAEAVQSFLDLPSRPTALFVWHDRNAYRILEEFESRGIRVPHHVSVVGYDGIVWPSTSRHVLASIEVPLDRMANQAVALLNQLIEGEPSPRSQTIPVRFLPGTTIGPLP